MSRRASDNGCKCASRVVSINPGQSRHSCCCCCCFCFLDIKRRRHVLDPQWMTSVLAVVLLVVSSASVIVQGQISISVQFNFTEEQPIGSVVGRIPTRSKLRYRLSVDSTLFAIDPVTGILTSISKIDRDTLPSDDIILLVQSIPSPPAEIVQVYVSTVCCSCIVCCQLFGQILGPI